MINIDDLIQKDFAHCWRPFTPMRQWRESEPLVIESAKGVYLYDAEGQAYLDAVSSLWCNVHGHQKEELDNAIRDQLNKVAHTTMLGLANPPSIELAARLAHITPGNLNKVFYSDAGATATELAFKMAIGYWHNLGEPAKTNIIALEGAYHGDTNGAMSVGYDPTFHKAFTSVVFKTLHSIAPDVAHDARWRQDREGQDQRHRVWSTEDHHLNELLKAEALDSLQQIIASHTKDHGNTIAAICLEPLIQGAAGMIHQPNGFLKAVRSIADKHDILLIFDEVATGFGRTGKMFAADHETVAPDIMCIGKGLSGGYLPLAATLATDQISEAFEGEIHEHKTLYHGHTFTGNPLACAAALASLNVFTNEKVLEHVQQLSDQLTEMLAPLRDAEKYPWVYDIRQKGLMTGIELSNGKTGKGFDPSRRLGYQVCEYARKHHVIMRPIGNVLILMPPLCITKDQLTQLVQVMKDGIEYVQMQ